MRPGVARAACDKYPTKMLHARQICYNAYRLEEGKSLKNKEIKIGPDLALSHGEIKLRRRKCVSIEL
jgi:hypothetical protein